MRAGDAAAVPLSAANGTSERARRARRGKNEGDHLDLERGSGVGVQKEGDRTAVSPSMHIYMQAFPTPQRKWSDSKTFLRAIELNFTQTGS